jgi:hypothetical protein
MRKFAFFQLYWRILVCLAALGVVFVSCETPTNSSTPATYTVTFDTNGGNGPAPAQKQVQEGSSITLPDGSGLTKTGEIFGGWNTMADGTGIDYSAGSSYRPTGNITLYAKWGSPSVIYYIPVTVTAPVKGAAPNTIANGTDAFTIGAVSWSPSDNPFLGETVYTATVSLTANNGGYTFLGFNSATINGNSATVSDNTGTSVTLSYTFPTTDTKTVTNIAIKTQPNKLTYTHGDQLDLTGLVVTLTHDDATTEDVSAANFTAKNITANPANGNHLSRSAHNGRPVTITYGGLPALSTHNLTVNAKAITFTVDSIPAQTYNRSAHTPAVTVRDGTATLALTTDYTAAYTNNTNAGTATVTITGTGNYAGSTGSATFIINPKVITFTVDPIPTQTYTGSARIPTVTVKDGTVTLALTTDYTAAYTNNINAGTATVTITGAGNYAGSTGSATFIISAHVITFTIDPIPAQTYTGSAITPTVTVKTGATTLTLTTDYTAAYTHNTNAGTATVTIAGAGNYAGSTGSANFTINPKVIAFTIDSIPAQTYNGSAHTPTVTVRDGATTLTLTTHYTAAYTNNINAGTATVTITGAGNYAGSTGSANFTINPKIITFTVNSISAQTYNGSAHTPTVTVRDGATTLTLTTHYTAAYTNNTNAGTATVTIAGAGNYAGSSSSANFTISPKSVIITGLSAAGKVYDGGVAATVTGTATIDGNIDGSNLTVVGGTATFAHKNVGNGKAVTFNNYSLGGTAAPNYNLSAQPTGVTADITPLRLVIAAPGGSPTKAYDGTTAYTGGGITIGSLINKAGGDTVSASISDAIYNDANVAMANQITIIYAISGADAANYSPPVNGAIAAVITRAAGAQVSAPTLASRTYNRITVNAVTAPVNGQTAEYAISTASNGTGLSAWQTGVVFTGLNANTTYYVYARSAESGNYHAGTTSVSAAITTPQSGTAGIVYYWVNEQDVLSITYSTGENAITLPRGQELTITAQGAGYTNQQWHLNGVNTGKTGITYTFSSMVSGKHTVGLFVQKDNKWYNVNFTITVE